MILPNRTSFQLTDGLVKRLKPFDVFIFYFLALSIIVSFFIVLSKLNNTLSVTVPVRFGEISEGFVGTPTSFNPIVAKTTIDQSVTSLLHAGLLKPNNDGTFSGELASSWQVSRDGLTYTIRLKSDAVFHDGTTVSENDFIQTIHRIQHPDTNSPLANIWEGVIVTGSDNVIQVVLPEVRYQFPYALTVDVLPYHIWRKVPYSETNIYRGRGTFIGAGPFQYKALEQTLDNQPTILTLKPFSDYILGEPYIGTYTFHFFQDVPSLLKAFSDSTINAVSGSSASELKDLLLLSEKPHSIFNLHTYRLFNIIFNVEDGRLLVNQFLRSVLVERIDRQRIVDGVFGGFARPIENLWAGDETKDDRLADVKTLSEALDSIGWKLESVSKVRIKDGVPLELNILIPDVKEFQQIIEVVVDWWEKLGISVSITKIPFDQFIPALQQGDFDAFLYGYNASSIPALYKFWHSASTDNLAAFANFGNEKINTLLEQLRTTIDDKTQEMVYNEVKEEIVRTAPAVFLFSPDLVYLLPSNVKGLEQFENTGNKIIVRASDRFTDVHTWYLHTENVWNIFIKEK